MPLPSCECVPQTIQGLLTAIYCALQEIAENGAAVNLESINGISAFWKATLGGTPAADQVFGTNGAGVFATFDVSEVGINFIGMQTPDVGGALVVLTDASIETRAGVTDTISPITSVTFDIGIALAAS